MRRSRLRPIVDTAVSFIKVGDVQVVQGELAGALKFYRDSLVILARLVQSDPGNAGWQHDLSAAINKVGDVQGAQGDLTGAMKSYRDASPSLSGWRNPIPATPAGSATCRWRSKR